VAAIEPEFLTLTVFMCVAAVLIASMVDFSLLRRRWKMRANDPLGGDFSGYPQ